MGNRRGSRHFIPRRRAADTRYCFCGNFATCSGAKDAGLAPWKPQARTNSMRPPSQRSRWARAAAGSVASSASAASRDSSTMAASRSRSAKRSSGTPLCRAPRNSPGPRMERSWRAISKPSCVFVDHFQALLAPHRTTGSSIQQDALALVGAAAHAAAQLVQLGQAETFGVLDDHQWRIGMSTPTSITVVATSTCQFAAVNASIVAAFSAGFISPVQQSHFSSG